MSTNPDLHIEKRIVRPSSLFPNAIQKHAVRIKCNKGMKLFPTSEIAYFKAWSNYTELHTLSGEKKLMSKTMKSIEQSLPSCDFIRVHQSYLANTDCIKHVFKIENKYILELANGVQLPISRRMKKNIR
jgi:two-component system LytT family response regulator